MLNNKNNKFDELVKKSLSNYEASEKGNWGRMERMLNANAKTNRPIWLSVSLGVLAIAGAYFIYENVNSDTKSATKVSSSIKKEITMPAVTKTESIKPAVIAEPVAKEDVNTAPPKTVLTMEDYKAKVAKIDKKINELVRKENTSTKVNDIKVSKPQSVSVMGNAPVFPEMIDSKKGIVNGTKESKEMQEKAMKTSAAIKDIKWTYFINKDGKRDSIRKPE